MDICKKSLILTYIIALHHQKHIKSIPVLSTDRIVSPVDVIEDVLPGCFT